MGQLNLHMTPVFERDLRKLMKIRHIHTKAEAIRTAIRECLEHSITQIKPTDFSRWVGIATKVPANKNRKFHSDDDLWK